MLITSAVLVTAVAVFGLATSETTVDLIGITVETRPLPRGPANPDEGLSP
jgi:hypothetical protein